MKSIIPRPSRAALYQALDYLLYLAFILATIVTLILKGSP